jgi:hypothetical protein
MSRIGDYGGFTGVTGAASVGRRFGVDRTVSIWRLPMLLFGLGSFFLAEKGDEVNSAHVAVLRAASPAEMPTTFPRLVFSI